MIAALVFVLLFLTLGLATVAVAMRSGKRRKGGPTRGQRTLINAGVIGIVVVLGIAVPVLVLVGNNDAKGAPGGVELSTAQKDGRQLFKRNCSTCHALGASNAVGRVGPDLDALNPPVELTLNAIEEGRARGMGQMPAGLVEGQEARDVAEYITAVAGRS